MSAFFGKVNWTLGEFVIVPPPPRPPLCAAGGCQQRDASTHSPTMWAQGKYMWFSTLPFGKTEVRLLWISAVQRGTYPGDPDHVLGGLSEDCEPVPKGEGAFCRVGVALRTPAWGALLLERFP